MYRHSPVPPLISFDFLPFQLEFDLIELLAPLRVYLTQLGVPQLKP